MLFFHLLLPFFTVIFFYRLGALADYGSLGGRRAATWAATSAAGWGVSLFVLRWPVFYGLALQLALLVGVFVASALWATVRGRYHA